MSIDDGTDTIRVGGRRSVRLPGYDYTTAGAYFVTVCTHQRQVLFGDIREDVVNLNELGIVVQTEWEATASMRKNMRSDIYVVMPNHFHAVAILLDDDAGTARRAPTNEHFGGPVPGSLATVVRAFKSASTRAINRVRNAPGAPVWQRGFYDHVIRDEAELTRAREYILNNPLRWSLDSENPAALHVKV